MGVDLHHVIVYGFDFPYDDISFDLKEGRDILSAEEGDVVVLKDPRGSSYAIIGVLEYVTDSSRRSQPYIEPQRLDGKPLELDALYRFLDDDVDATPIREKPSWYVLTVNR